MLDTMRFDSNSLEIRGAMNDRGWRVWRAMRAVMMAMSLMLLAACAASSGPADRIYDGVERLLDQTYAEMGKPAPSEQTMRDLQAAAGKEIMKRMSSEWSELLTFSLNAEADRIVITVKVSGGEKTGEWMP